MNERRKFDRRRALLIAGGLLPVALGTALIAIAALVFAGRGETAASDRAVEAAMKTAGCTLSSFPALGRGHFTDINARGRYNSFPPTSGPHYHAPVDWGAYREPLVQSQLLHNLEHGGVAIQFGDGVDTRAIQQVFEFMRADPVLLVLAPLPRLRSRIALTAWTVPKRKRGEPPKRGTGRLATCSRFDEAAFRSFVHAYRGRGPESPP